MGAEWGWGREGEELAAAFLLMRRGVNWGAGFPVGRLALFCWVTAGEFSPKVLLRRRKGFGFLGEVGGIAGVW